MNNLFKNRFFVAILIIACFITGFMLNAFTDGGLTPHGAIIGVVFSPVQNAVSSLKQRLSDLSDSMSRYDELSKKYEDLRLYTTELERKISESRTYEVEISRLRSLLDIVGTENEYEMVEADVVSFSGDGWGSVFSINKGSTDGLSKGDVVLSSSGLAGRIKEVGPYWAKVVTILDPSLSVGVRIVETGDVCTTEGSISLMSEGYLGLAHVDISMAVTRGSRVETSGLGGAYPPGLYVGKIFDVKPDPNGLTQYGIVSPGTDFENLVRVYVIIGFESEVMPE